MRTHCSSCSQPLDVELIREIEQDGVKMAMTKTVPVQDSHQDPEAQVVECWCSSCGIVHRWEE